MNGSDLILAVALLSTGAVVSTFVGVFRRSRRAPTTGKVVAGNLLLLLALLCTVFSAGEIYYRFLHDTTDAYHVSLVSNRWAERHYRFNNVGMRDDIDYTPAIPPGRTRVMIAGDSYTNGHGVPRVEDRFANRLRRDHPDWDVILLASDGMDTGPLLDRLRGSFAAGYRADVVLYAYGLNDISDLITELSGALRRLYEEDPGFIVRHSYLVNTYYYRFRIAGDDELASYFELLVDAYSGPRWKRQQQRLRSLAAMVERQNARLLVATFPFYELLEAPEFQKIHRQLAEFWDDLGVPQIDMSKGLDGYSVAELTVNRQDTHPSELAHRLAADALGPFVERHLPADRRPAM